MPKTLITHTINQPQS